MATARMKELFRKYGRTAVGVHLGVYATSLAGVFCEGFSYIVVNAALGFPLAA